MWKVRKLEEGERLVLGISGRIEGRQLTQLQKALASEGWSGGAVLDLVDLKLVDQQSVVFLARCEADGGTLRNCPGYIREWIDKEMAAK